MNRGERFLACSFSVKTGGRRMRKPVVDYRQFRFSKINTPQFSHLLLLLGWVGHFILFFLTENLIPVERCHVIHCSLDDIIPFCEWFLLPYVFWYLFIAGSLFYFLLYDIDSFKKLQTYIIITEIVAIITNIQAMQQRNQPPNVA